MGYVSDGCKTAMLFFSRLFIGNGQKALSYVSQKCVLRNYPLQRCGHQVCGS